MCLSGYVSRSTHDLAVRVDCGGDSLTRTSTLCRLASSYPPTISPSVLIRSKTDGR